ncbi:MAG: tRNA (cytidine(34)-2'-O)-methyltransferase [Gammaproteobacteria bacterium]|nr:tRNA (cytidine(34)-2'-O)-methyltransferase [Gammaproteobacteria bacterium]NNM00713.1 tRNA (cytidine(34)-2'-O)-methyltransferase [Gammaproteobacteria bacterium]
MLHIVLYEPEIPPNTGNIIRLAANLGWALHLIKPYGFSIDDRRLRRAGLDYAEFADLREHDSFAAFRRQNESTRILACSTRGRRCYSEIDYAAGDALLFGPETRGLPADLLAGLPPEQVLRLPMQPGSRSLNLSNAAAVIAYEAARQLGFPGLV